MLQTTIFCEIDDFCKEFEKKIKSRLLSSGSGKRNCHISMTLSEVMTIQTLFHLSGYKTFKEYYEKHVLIHMLGDFPRLVSYNRFIELKQKALLPLLIFMQLKALKGCTGISFIDSFSLEVCHNKRIHSHKVFRGLAQRGKTSIGWFYGFKLHLVINPFGEIVACFITPGNVSDNNELVLSRLTKELFGKIFGDKGYIINRELFEKLFINGLHVITKLRKNMKNQLMTLEDKLLLRKRGIIESVGNILKNSLSIEHSRHRSILGFFIHVVSALNAYAFRSKKPSIAFNSYDNTLLA